MPTDAYAWIEDCLRTIQRANWYRSVQAIQGRPGPTVVLEGRQVLNFASNDYLGLAADQRLIQAAIAALEEFGTSSTGSRLLSGHRPLHRQLERALADWKHTEDALVFSSGYLANLGTISALVGARDLVLSDQYNHSSLKNGASLSRATVINYAHCNIQDLQAKLEKHWSCQVSGQNSYRRCLILTESVFSMDGDLSPLPDLLAIAEQYGCMLLVDEAHATGVLGPTGSGGVEHWGCSGQSLIQVGTLSKALGSLGGYVAGSATLIDFLRNRAPSWIYTTGLSPADTAAALAAIAIARQESWRRTQLWQNVHDLKARLAAILELIRTQSSLQLLSSKSPIVCVQVKDAHTVLQLGYQLQQRGIFAAAIRPPTVPTSRIRLTVMATHRSGDCQRLVEVLNLFDPSLRQT